MWPRSVAGVSPSLSPRTFAASSTISMRWRNLAAVSCFVAQIGFSTSTTCSVVIWSGVSLPSVGKAYLASVDVQIAGALGLRLVGVRALIRPSATASKSRTAETDLAP